MKNGVIRLECLLYYRRRTHYKGEPEQNTYTHRTRELEGNRNEIDKKKEENKTTARHTRVEEKNHVRILTPIY